MQMIKLAIMGNRVEIATLIEASTVVSMKASARPGTTCSISVLQSCQVGSSRLDSLASYTTLNETLARKMAPNTMNKIATGHKIPRNFPRINERRLMGLDNTVRAVRPSISSAMETLAVQRARIAPRIMIKVKPVSLTIFTSSPKVL